MPLTLVEDDAVAAYPGWRAPDVIVSDGAYGVGGFPGDPRSPDGLAEWYAPHVAGWSEAAKPSTVLWFWCTEVGWVNVHPLLVASGWEYVQTVTWDKGVGHVAGNVNGRTIRRFPVVTEVCVLYTRTVRLGPDALPVRDWLRDEWVRTGLPWRAANIACGVANAATRKYLTADDAWYPPSGDMVSRLAGYANEHGEAVGRPYFDLVTALRRNSGHDGCAETGADGGRGGEDVSAVWDALRYSWTHTHGLTNVWAVPALRGSERVRVNGRTVHANQKPVELMRRILHATAAPGAVVWEPFGGLVTASVVASAMGCDAYAAESNPVFAAAARRRVAEFTWTPTGSTTT